MTHGLSVVPGGVASGAWRRPAIAVLLLALVAPAAVTTSIVWSSTGAAMETAQRERDGVTLLRPLTRLLAATADAQTAAFGGKPVDEAAVRAAVGDVDAASAALGAPVLVDSWHVDARWADVKSRLATIVTSRTAGAQAYAAYGQVTDLQLAMIAAVGEASSLVLDPEVDSHYLMDAALLRIPAILVSAGRSSDLAALTAHPPATGGTGGQSSTLAVIRTELRAEGKALDAGLRKSFAATHSRTLGPGLLARLDQLADALTALAPPADEVGVAAGSPLPAAQETARGQVRDAALAVDGAALDQLETSLGTRLEQARSTRLLAALSVIGGLLVAVALGWLVRRRRGAPLSGVDAVQWAPAAPPDRLEARDLLARDQLVLAARGATELRERR